MKNRTEWLDVSDAPVFCTNAFDCRAEAFEEATKVAKNFAIAFVLYNGLYYHVTASSTSVELWKRKGYKIIRIEYSEAMKRQLGIN